MAIWAQLLKDTLNQFLGKMTMPKFKNCTLLLMNRNKFGYAIVILFPFWRYTQAISISQDISIHLAWQIYNKLFSILDPDPERLKENELGKSLS